MFLFNRKVLSTAIAASLFAVPVQTVLAQEGAATSTPITLAQAQIAGTVQGRVTDSSTGVILQGATVEIPALNVTATTDSEGRYTLRQVPAGEHVVTVRYIDRGTGEQSINVVANSNTPADFALIRVAQAGRIEEIVTFGRLIADSEAAALQRQRAANNVSNIIASDAIGRFPDQNAADALGRVSGIAIERDQGQARYVNVRGAPAEFSNIAFNGVAAPTPSQGGRSARFDTISNHVIKSIQVVKAVTPDIPADSIGGFINVETNGPFDRPGLKFDAAVSRGINELGGGDIEQYQLTMSNTFRDDTIGFLISASSFSTNRVVDNAEGQFNVFNDEQWVRGVDWRNYRGKRDTESLNTRFDWRPTDNIELYANVVRSQFSDWEIRDMHQYDMDDSHYGHIRSRTGYDPSISNPVSGTILGVNIDANFNTRTDIQSVLTTQFGGSMSLPQMEVKWVGGFNQSKSIRDRDSAYWDYIIPRYAPTSSTDPTPRNPSVSMTYDRTNPDDPQVKVYETAVNPDGTLGLGQRLSGIPIDAFQFRDLEISDTLGQVDERFFNIDLERPWTPFGISSDMKFGARFSQRNATLRDTDLEVNASAISGLGLDTSYAAILSGKAPSTQFPQPAMLEIDRNKTFERRDVVFDAARANDAVWTQNEVWRNFYNVDENVYAIYAMNTFHWDKFDVIAGVRAEYTDMSGIGHRPLNEGAIRSVLREGQREIVLDDLYAARDANGNPLLEVVQGKKDYLDFFPALHINYRPQENLVYRLAYTESILRPSYSQFAPNRNVSDDSDFGQNGLVFISGGNPDLDPYRSKNVDAYVEYYLPYRGILSLGFFAKWIDDPIFGSTQSVAGAPYGFPGSEVRLSGPLNGSDGRIKGVEFNYSQQFGFLPEPLDGFGFSFNYTYSDDSAMTPPVYNPATGRNDGLARQTGLTGASRTTLNTSIFFEKFGISTRLSYQYRSPWLNVIDLGEPRMDRYWDSRPSLDYSFRYSFNDNWILFLDANNLTDANGRRYNGNRNNVYELEGFGRSYMTGIRMSF